MLYLISLGLYDKNDVSLKAISAAKKCKILYIERYTNFFGSSNKKLERLFKKKIIELKREEVESLKLINEAKKSDIGLLIIGDVFSATTHSALMLEAINKKIKVEAIHGSSILTAIGETGLILYNFGKIASIPKENKNIETPYEALKGNNQLHTLFLLDLDLSFNEAIEYLLYLEDKKKEKIFNPERLCVVCCQIGGKNIIKSGKAKDLLKLKIKDKPQCLIVPGKLHFLEEEMIEKWNISK